MHEQCNRQRRQVGHAVHLLRKGRKGVKKGRPRCMERSPNMEEKREQTTRACGHCSAGSSTVPQSSRNSPSSKIVHTRLANLRKIESRLPAILRDHMLRSGSVSSSGPYGMVASDFFEIRRILVELRIPGFCTTCIVRIQNVRNLPSRKDNFEV
ncbi:hypothetical protein N657DRAFT_313139 [Parathielavia appendiculata]|uniref:Uncharacterized protein n=1 Tax=Parathielavia appendiculata TaxID=2587402 RepID=A0AAN6U5X4_9PEZI|nr:hypothetical protein N657DRAFT_313139 [Parathielavia appendiculata]